MKTYADLDKLDRNILWHMDNNGRIQSSSLARLVRRGSDTVRYRVNRFFDSGLVNNVIPLINVGALGCSIYKTYCKLRVKPARIEEMIAYLDSSPSTYWLSEWYGRWDLMFSFAAKTPRGFSELQSRVFDRFSDIIEETNLTINTRTFRFPKNYLIGKRKSFSVQTITDTEYDIEPFDILLLSELSRDSRQSTAELARKLDTTQAIVSYRMEKLEQSGVLLRYRLQFNYTQARLLLFKIFIEVEQNNEETKKRFFDYAEKDLRITCLVEQLGSHPFEIEVELENYDDIHEFVNNLRKKMCGVIRSVDYAVLRRDHYHRMPDILHD